MKLYYPLSSYSQKTLMACYEKAALQAVLVNTPAAPS
jgi:hypothetical protein